MKRARRSTQNRSRSDDFKSMMMLRIGSWALTADCSLQEVWWLPRMAQWGFTSGGRIGWLAVSLGVMKL